MPKTRRFPKPKQRNTFTVIGSLISNRNRVSFLAPSNRGSTSSHQSEPDVQTSFLFTSNDEPLQPALREEKTPQTWSNRKEKAAGEWFNVLGKLQQSWLQHEGAIDGAFCVECATAPATVRCKDCGPEQFYCENCAVVFHSKRCCFHVLEKWENGFYSPMVVRKRFTSLLHQHDTMCQTKEKIINIIDHRGICNEVEFKFCSCEHEGASLIRSGFWPFSPKNPQSAISLDLLDIIYIYMMECQVSLKRSCSAIRLLAHSVHRSKINVPNVYKNLANNESMQQYCIFRYHLNYSITKCDPGNVCPACPKDSDGTIIHSFDACFGLVRKKTAGESTCPPVLEGIFFRPQKDVDEFVTNYASLKKKAKIVSDCNEFHAGEIQSMIRSKGKAKVFDEKAVLGGICRHEAPTVGFMNTKAGEKISFSIYYLQDLLKKSSSQVFFIYDIGCVLHKHIQNSNGSLKNRVTLALPSFHCFGHKYSCQVKFGPKRCEGIGLSDGEATEQLWSYLRRFSAITKEMTASNRINTLTLCLLHYMERSKEKLGKLLVTRFQKAEKMLTNSEDELTTLLTTLPGVTTDTVADWIQEESSSILEKKDQSKAVSWKERYVAKLLELEDLRNEMTTTDNVDSVVVLAKSFKTKDKEIKNLEKKEKVQKRWLITEDRFRKIARKVSLCKLEDLKKDLHKIALERWFYITLKSKYADGQSIAKKLAKSITKKTKELRQVLKIYNNHKNNICGLEGTQRQDIELTTACDPTSAFFNSQEEEATLPLSMKRKAMDLYLMSLRSKEEKALLVQEMQQTIKHYHDLKHGLSKSIVEEEESGTVPLGALIIMRKQLCIVTCTLSELTQLFSPYIRSHISVQSTVVFTDDDEFDDADDDDEDSDDDEDGCDGDSDDDDDEEDCHGGG